MNTFKITHIAIFFCSVVLAGFLPLPAQENRREDLSPLSQAAKKAGIEKFKPNMLGHFHRGCPSNSSCSKEMGKKRQKWNELLKKVGSHGFDRNKMREELEAFRREVGIPFSLWTTIDSDKLDFTAKNMPEVISWRSQCDQHQPSEDDDRRAIYMSEVMVKNLKDIPKKRKNTQNRYIFNRAFLASNSGSPTRYLLPRDETPVMLQGQDLVFLREQDGYYYNLAIAPDGELHIGPSQYPEVFPQETQCPKPLQKAFAKNLKDDLPHLYQQFFCQKIWNRKTGKTQTMIFGWSCP